MGRRKKEEQGRREKENKRQEHINFLRKDAEREGEQNKRLVAKFGPGPRNKEPAKIQVH